MAKDPERESAAPARGVSAEAAGAEQTPAAPVEGDAVAEQQQVEALRAEVEEHRERSLRLAAELENVRRRTARESEMARRFALERFATDMLPVADSLELALESAQDASEGVREGLEMTLKLLRDVFARHHIEAVAPAAGEPFDPSVHEAMATQPSEDTAPDAVLTLVQKGYCLHDRLLRPARVIVARRPEADA